jgi:hypothetical protein
MRNRFRSRRSIGAVASGALVLGLGGLGAFPAVAQDTDVFSCRASALRVTAGAGQFETEPVRANEQSAPCSSQRSEVFGAQNFSAPAPFSASADIAAAGAYTSRATDGVGALAGLGNSTGRVGTPFGTQSASFESAQTSVSWRCSGGTATVSTSSRIVGLTINGVAAPVPSGPQTFPLPGGAVLHVNRVQRQGNLVIVRAVELTHPDAGTVVLAEAQAGYTGSVAAACEDLAGTPSDTGTRPCPAGSTFEPGSGNCVIRETGPGGQSQTTVVSKPFEGPQGGSVLSLAQARQRYPNSPCVKGSGPNVVIVGTNRNDDITGTTRADRILLLAGSRDEAEGGTGGDCIDGGRGRDVISGAVGNDRLYGEAGNDSLVGGSHVDRLSGGAGADTLHTGYGRDSAYGGPGNDRINAATGGPPVKVVSCGKGRDNVRINRNEKRRVRRDCERVQVLVDRA